MISAIASTIRAAALAKRSAAVIVIPNKQSWLQKWDRYGWL
jgi:hypothetical protein